MTLGNKAWIICATSIPKHVGVWIMQSQEIRKEKEVDVGIHKLHSEQHHL